MFFAPQFRVCSSRQCDYSRCRPRVDGRATASDTVKKCCYNSTAATATIGHMRTVGTPPRHQHIPSSIASWTNLNS